MSDSFRYPTTTILLHWLTAFLVASSWFVSQIIDLWPRGARMPVRSVHILLGLVLAVVILARIALRLAGRAGSPPHDPGLLNRLARAAHLLLYVLVIAEIVFGLANSWVRGESFFGLVTIAPFDPANRTLRQLVGDLHEITANAILIVAGGHAAAALLHHYVLRDNILRRMLPGGSH